MYILERKGTPNATAVLLPARIKSIIKSHYEFDTEVLLKGKFTRFNNGITKLVIVPRSWLAFTSQFVRSGVLR